MAQTKQQLAEAVANRLSLLMAGEALSALDSDLIERTYDTWREEAIDKGGMEAPTRSMNTPAIQASALCSAYSASLACVSGRTKRHPSTKAGSSTSI